MEFFLYSQRFLKALFQSKKTYFSILVFFVVFSFLFLPAFTQAAWWNPTSWGDDIIRGLAILIVGAVTSITGLIFFTVAAVANWMIGVSMDIAVVPGKAPDFVTAGFNFTRQFVNMLFLLILVFIGLATILRLQAYQLQRLLPKLIIVALLVNFSGLLVGLLVDISNLLASFFLIEAGKIGSGAFGDIFTTGANRVNQIFEDASGSGLVAAFVGALTYGFVMSVFFIFSSFAYLALLIIFFLRLVLLWTLVILAPLAFAASILPVTQGLWNRWLSSLIQWAFLAVPIAFFMFLANSVLNAATPVIKAKDPLSLTGEVGFMTELVTSLLTPFVAIVILIIGMGIAMSMAPASAKSAMRFGRSAAVVGTGMLMRDVVRKRLAESKKFRGASEKMSAGTGPKWGQGSWAQKGLLKRSIAGAQGRAAGVVGYAGRKTGSAGTNRIVDPHNTEVEQKTRAKAAKNSVHANVEAIRDPRKSAAEKAIYADEMLKRKQFRNATNTAVMGKNGALTAEDMSSAYKQAHESRNTDLQEGLERGFINDDKAMASFAKIREDSNNLRDEDEQSVGDAKARKVLEERGDLTTEEIDQKIKKEGAGGLTQEELDQGVTNYRQKVISEARSPAEIQQLQRGWQNNNDAMDAVHDFWGGPQVQAAANEFGNAIIDAVDRTKKDAAHYFEPAIRGKAKTDEGQDYQITAPRNAALARWLQANGGQALGATPVQGLEEKRNIDEAMVVARKAALEATEKARERAAVGIGPLEAGRTGGAGGSGGGTGGAGGSAGGTGAAGGGTSGPDAGSSAPPSGGASRGRVVDDRRHHRRRDGRTGGAGGGGS